MRAGLGLSTVKTENMDDEKAYKLVLAGRYGVGKSRIFEQLQCEVDGFMRGLQTVEVGTGTGKGNREKWMVRVSLPSCGRDVTAILWDTGQMERYGIDCMTRSYFAGCQGLIGVILVYDKGDLESLNGLKEWITAAREYNSTTGSSTIFSLWGNDTGNDENPVEEYAARDFGARYGISPKLIFTVNASTGDNLVDCFQTVVDAIHLTDTSPRRAEESYGDVVELQKPICNPPQSKWAKCMGRCYE